MIGMTNDGKTTITQLLIRKKLVLGDLTLDPGTIIDGVEIDKDTYKIFVRNGWWVIDGIYIADDQRPTIFDIVHQSGI